MAGVLALGMGAASRLPAAAAPRQSGWHYGVFAGVAMLCGFAPLLLAKYHWEAALSPLLFYPLLAAIAAAAIRHAQQLRRLRRRTRRGYEQLLLLLFMTMAAAAILITVGIIASVIVEAINFFSIISPWEFLFGTQWSPQIAIRDDQVGGSGAFGFIPLLTGTLLISGIAMLVATPIGLLAAIYLSDFAKPGTRRITKPILEILAGIPTIVYGFFAVAFLSPLLVDIGKSLGVGIASENALAAGLVMGAMLIPIIASLSEDAFHAVPESLRQGAIGLGATRYEAAVQVVIPAALPGVMAGMLLAFSRAVGETMIVVMAAGISANLTINPLEAVTTVTVQIVTLLTGDQTFDDAKTLASFALGLVLFIITLLFNLMALYIVRRFRERYE